MTGIKSVHTIEKYLNYFEEAFIFFRLNAFSFKVKEQIRSNKKIYCIDNGLITARSFKISENTGKLYENLVAVELKKQELRGELKFYYYRNPQGYEVDFVLCQEIKIVKLIQVCSDVNDEETKKREVRALLYGSRDLKCDDLLVITDDYESTEKIE